MDDDESIYLSIEVDNYLIDIEKLKNTIKRITSALHLDNVELSIRIVDPSTIKDLNASYRDKDTATDVLSFPQVSWETKPNANQPVSIPKTQGTECSLVLGDIVISMENALENAQQIGQSLDREVAFLLTHGILHLCGYDHMTAEEEIEMIEQQDLIMKALASHNLTPVWQDCASEKGMR